MWHTCTGDYTVPVSLDPWDGADLVATARLHTGIGADQELSPSQRFRRNVAKLLKRRHSVEDARRDSLAVFILYPHPPDRVTHDRIPMLDNGCTEVVGRIWFVNEAVRTGHYIEDIPDDDALLFDTICTQIGLGDSPTIVFDPRLANPTIRFYPVGLSSEDTCIVHAISDTEVSPDTINRVVERIYESSFITPDAEVPGASSVWQDSHRCWPSRSAEAVVQAHLKTGLHAYFFDCDIRHEQPSRAGRLDLEIERSDPNDYFTITRLAVIELKVLRSFRYNGCATRADAIPRWIAKGVRQVVAYRNERCAQMGMLMCFDMRDSDTGEQCFSHVSSLARNLSVHLSRWFLYNSSEAYRDAGLA